MLALSLLVYKRDSLLKRMPSVPAKSSTLAERFALHLPVLMFYTPVHRWGFPLMSLRCHVGLVVALKLY